FAPGCDVVATAPSAVYQPICRRGTPPVIVRIGTGPPGLYTSISEAAVAWLSPVHTPLPRPLTELSSMPLEDSEPSLNTYTISGRPLRAAYSRQAPMHSPARMSRSSPVARSPVW